MPELNTGNKRAPLVARGDDLYETPAVAVHALLNVEKLPYSVWEPACGPGAIAKVLRAAGHNVFASDLIDYKWSGQDASGWDFLMESHCPPTIPPIDAIVTNPPFKNASTFVTHALRLCPRVIMLLRLAFIESVSRSDVLDSGLLARIYVFRRRLPRMHRAGWEGDKASNAMAFAWFVWDANHQGQTTIARINWER